MHYTTIIQQDNATCNSSLKYSRVIHTGFYIAFDIILICLTGDCFIYKLKLRDPFKSYEMVPSVRLQWIFTHPSM